MRVLIDATSVLLRSAGIKSYTYHWINHMRVLAGRDVIRAFPLLDNLQDLTHERSVLGPMATVPRLALLYLANMPGLGAIDRLAHGADVFHLSNQLREPPRRVRVTATVHDLTCWITPQLHTAANVRADQSFAHRVWKRADGLIAVSENSRRDAVERLGIPESRIETIYSGVASEYFDAAPASAPKPYVLFLGTIEPRKNVGTLLDAWHMLRGDLRVAFDLVVAGAGGWASESTVARLQAGIAGVRYLGYVPEAELPGLTAGATAFVYPSLYEGFGFPVAQAMASGVPVVTSNNSCLPEVAGEGALYVDARSALDLSRALERVLESASLRRALGAAGRARAEQYRWETCAQRSLQFFSRVIG